MPEHQDFSFKLDPGPEPRSKDAAQQNEQIDYLLEALTDSDQIAKPDWVFDRDSWRDCRMLTLIDGTSGINRLIVGREMTDHPAFL